MLGNVIQSLYRDCRENSAESSMADVSLSIVGHLEVSPRVSA